MSGRVQKESADDSDRIDDAVDPRVQVNQCVLSGIIYKPSEVNYLRYY